MLFNIFTAYYKFAVNNPDHYQLMFNTKWDEKKHPEIKLAATKVFEKAAFSISKAMPEKHMTQENVIEKTAISDCGGKNSENSGNNRDGQAGFAKRKESHEESNTADT